MKTTREIALDWWKKLGYSQTTKLFAVYKSEQFSPSEKPSRLTGREIEIIYNKYKTI